MNLNDASGWDGSFDDVFTAMNPTVDARTRRQLEIISKSHGLKMPKFFESAFVYNNLESARFPFSASYLGDFNRPLPANLDADAVEFSGWDSEEFVSDLERGLFGSMKRLFVEYRTEFGGETGRTFARLLRALASRADSLEQISIMLSVVDAPTQVDVFPDVPVIFAHQFARLQFLELDEVVLAHIVKNASDGTAPPPFPVLKYMKLHVAGHKRDYDKYRGLLAALMPELKQLSVIFRNGNSYTDFFQQALLPRSLRCVAITPTFYDKSREVESCIKKLETTGLSENIQCLSIVERLGPDLTLPHLTQSKWPYLVKLRTSRPKGFMDLIGSWSRGSIKHIVLPESSIFSVIDVAYFEPAASFAKETLIIGYIEDPQKEYYARQSAGLGLSDEASGARCERLLKERTGLDVIVHAQGGTQFPNDYYLVD
jgi:hypothetical protein